MAEAEGVGWAAPLVVAEANGVGGLVALQQEEVVCHVLGGGGCGVGDYVEWVRHSVETTVGETGGRSMLVRGRSG